jgi:hypothetical protein
MFSSFSQHSLVVNNNTLKPFENIGEASAVPLSINFNGVCFDYALHHFGFNLNYHGRCKNAFKVVLDNFYQIEALQAEKGDLIIYHECKKSYPFRDDDNAEEWGYVQHFGIIIKPNLDYKKMIIESKWGGTPVYRHELGAVPDCYGNNVSFWRYKGRNLCD